jgi:hypothetical protein
VAAQAEGVRRFLLDQIVDDDLGPVQEVVIHDPNTVDAVSADLITEGREFRGICALSFATVVITPKADGPSAVEGIVCARLRLSLRGGHGPSQHARQNPEEVHAREAGDALSEIESTK